MQVYLAEKASQGKAIAAGLGIVGQAAWLHGTPYLGDEQRVVCWAQGHVLESFDLVDYNPEWKEWRLDNLPLIPEESRWKEPKSGTPEKTALSHLTRLNAALQTRGGVTEFVQSCDAGREGEHIGRLVGNHFGWTQAPRCSRLWTSSLTKAAVQKANVERLPLNTTDRLGAAAKLRDRSDFLLGANLTRLFTVQQRRDHPEVDRRGNVVHIGRVATGLLGFVHDYDLRVENFVSERYHELELTARATTGNGAGATIVLTHSPAEAVMDRSRLEALRRTAEGWAGPVAVETREIERPPPLALDLATLQTLANRKLGYSPAKTLALAQSLYANHQAITYPRTDCQYWAPDEIDECNDTAAKLGIHRASEISSRVVDKARTDATDHTAIRPTGEQPQRLTPEEATLFKLIVDRFAAQYAGPWKARYTRFDIQVETADGEKTGFTAMHRETLADGWRGVDGDHEELPGSGESESARSQQEREREAGRAAAPDNPPPAIGHGDQLAGESARTTDHWTRAPPTLTEGRLIQHMKRNGMGTQATQADHIERLLIPTRALAYKQGKRLRPTERGSDVVRCVQAVCPALATLDAARYHEQIMSEVTNGNATFASASKTLDDDLRDAVRTIRAQRVPPIRAPSPKATKKGRSRGAPRRTTQRT